MAENVQKCTHLVANKVLRTVKFLTAIPVVKHVVTSEWLEESWKSQKFMGEWGTWCSMKDHAHWLHGMHLTF